MKNTLHKIAQNKAVCIGLLIFVFPLGIYLALQNENWKKRQIGGWIASSPLMTVFGVFVLYHVLDMTMATLWKPPSESTTDTTHEESVESAESSDFEPFIYDEQTLEAAQKYQEMIEKQGLEEPLPPKQTEAPTARERMIVEEFRRVFYQMEEYGYFPEEEIYEIVAPDLGITVEELARIHAKVASYENGW